MVNNLPGTNIPDIRDYIYIDRQRVGSLLAQLSDGLSDEKTEVRKRSNNIKAGIARIFEIDRGEERSKSVTIALADLHVSQLEEASEALGLLADLSRYIGKRKNWLRSKVRNHIAPGMLIRVTAPTSITDTESILNSVRGISAAFPSSGDNQMMAIADQIESLYGKSINVSIFPTEDDNDREVAFVGEIPHNHSYDPFKRELITPQIGTGEPRLTSILQVSAVPTDHDDRRSPQQVIADISRTFEQTTQITGFDRSLIDQFLSAFERLLAQTGFVSAPKWPAISVIPLAIYRNVTPVHALEQEVNEEISENSNAD